eukprot:8730317-Pyramimonas_sp.AAC.1
MRRRLLTARRDGGMCLGHVLLALPSRTAMASEARKRAAKTSLQSSSLKNLEPHVGLHGVLVRVPRWAQSRRACSYSSGYSASPLLADTPDGFSDG